MCVCVSTCVCLCTSTVCVQAVCVCVCALSPAESFVVTEDHRAELEDEISVPEGAVVEVTVKKLSGWWQVR